MRLHLVGDPSQMAAEPEAVLATVRAITDRLVKAHGTRTDREPKALPVAELEQARKHARRHVSRIMQRMNAEIDAILAE